MRTRTILAAAPIFAAGALLGWSVIAEPLRTTVVAQEGKPDPRAKPAPAYTPAQLAERALHRRSVEAVIWGMPAVNYDLMLQEMLTKTAGKVNQVIYWGWPLDWHNQTLTPNPDTLYFVAFFNTKDVGPNVIDIVGGLRYAEIQGIEIEALTVAAPLESAPLAGVFDKDPAHGLGRSSKEVPAAIPIL